MVVASQQQIYPQIIQRSYYTPVVRQDHVRVTMNFNIIAALSCVKFPTNMYETTLLYLRRHKATVFVILNVLFAVYLWLDRSDRTCLNTLWIGTATGNELHQ